MISDVLSESIIEINEYLEAFPEVYKNTKKKIKRLLKEMEILRIELDTPPEWPSSVPTRKDKTK